MAANADLLDLAISHEVGLQRAFSREQRETEARLARVEAPWLRSLEGRPPLRLAKPRHDLIYQHTRFELQGSMREIALWELGFQRRMIARALEERQEYNIPSPEEIERRLARAKFAGETWRQHALRAERASWRAVRDELAKLPADATREAVREALERARSKMHALRASLLRTMYQLAVTVAREAFYEANPDLGRRVRILAVLDDRTSWICQNMHGTEFPVGVGARPPFHHWCRSVAVLVLIGGGDAAVPTFTEWWRRQPREVQDESLGQERAEWLRSHPRSDVPRAWRVAMTRTAGESVRGRRLRELKRGALAA